MEFITQVLATVALATSCVAAQGNGVQLSEVFGGPHGDKYSDMDLIAPGQVVRSITIRTGERVNGVGLDIKKYPGREWTSLYHGGGGGDGNTLTLSTELTGYEYVQCMEAHWGEYHSHTRIRYIKFTTNRNTTIDRGTPTTKIGKDCAPEGYQLGGFIGYSGKELDSVGAIWTSISPVAGRPFLSRVTQRKRESDDQCSGMILGYSKRLVAVLIHHCPFR